MSFKDYFKISEVFTYWFKNNKNANTSVKVMHWTNRISMFVFLIGAIIIIYKLFTR